MDAILLDKVADDLRALMHAGEDVTPALIEKDPRGIHWGAPLGFASLAAAGALLIAAGGVQTQVLQRKGAAHAAHAVKKKHHRPLHPRPVH